MTHAANRSASVGLEVLAEVRLILRPPARVLQPMLVVTASFVVPAAIVGLAVALDIVRICRRSKIEEGTYSGSALSENGHSEDSLDESWEVHLEGVDSGT